MNEDREILKSDFPSNSKTEKKEVKKVEKVIKGNVKQKKKSLGKKFIETFVGEDIENVGQYIIYDVLVPAAKDAISDMIEGGISMLFYNGDKRGSRTRRSGSKSYVSYDKCSYGSRDRDRREFSSKSRARFNFDDIVLETRGEAEEVLSHLVDLTIDYDQATVADLYDLVGITGNFTDNKYGWTDLSSASVSRTRDGYVLNLPKTMLLD